MIRILLLASALACAPAAPTPPPPPAAAVVAPTPSTSPPPAPPPTCAEGEALTTTCLECGPTDGCLRSAQVCRPTCDAERPCADGDCHQGVCGAFLCG